MADTTVIYLPLLCGNQSVPGTEFLDNELTFNRSTPFLPACFQGTVIAWTPCVILWLISVFYFPYLNTGNIPYKAIPLSKLYITKLVLLMVILAMGLLDLFKAILETYANGTFFPLYFYISPSVLVLTMVLAIVLQETERRRHVHSSGPFYVFWLCMLFKDVFDLGNTILRIKDEGFALDPFTFSTFVIRFTAGLIQFILCILFVDIPKDRETSETSPLVEKKYSRNGKPPCPEESCTFMSFITHWWIARLLIIGYKRVLTFNDLYDVLEADKSRNVVARFEKEWTKRIGGPSNMGSKLGERVKVKRSLPSLFLTLVKAEQKPFLLAFFFRLLMCFTEFINPLLLQLVINVISEGRLRWEGYLLAFALLLGGTFSAVIIHLSAKYGFVMSMRVRAALTTAIYRKTLKLSSQARHQMTVGEITNLVSVDAQKIDETFSMLNELWACPLQIVIAMVLLWNIMGPSSLAGLGVLVILAPINGLVLVKVFNKMQGEQMKFKDQRVKLINQMLSGIKVIKMYAWEASFIRRITDIRKQELRKLRSQAFINALIGVLAFCAPYLVTLAMFGAFVLESPDNILTPEKAFVSLSIVVILNAATSYVPMFITFISQAYISINRISNILLEEEIDTTNVTKHQHYDGAISIDDGTFSWDGENSYNYTLKNINLNIHRGHLVAVVGQVGSGKSSLISAILGEIHKIQGIVNVKGSTAYVSQQAWIQNATVQDNILFGESLDSLRYNGVLSACALLPDLDILPAADRTEIGEKGINLSGGQKQRVSLARAVYQNRDVYLLDDPLSAVDVHVGKQLFRKVIGPLGLLKSKTRILVTHSINYLHLMDKIIVLKDGRISEVGSYQDLLDNDGDFSEFVTTYSLEAREARSSDETSGSGTDYGGQLVHQNKLRKRWRHPSGEESRIVSKPVEERSANLIEEETAAQGTFKLGMIKIFLKAGGNVPLILLVLCYMIYVVALVLTDIWLSAWSDDPQTTGPEARKQTIYRLAVYAAFGSLQILSVAGLSLSLYLGCLHATRVMHSRLLHRILRAPMAFFDTTPLGRIFNRFSTDVDKLDTTIPQYSRYWLFNMAAVWAIIIIISYGTTIFLAAVFPMFAIYIILERIYATSVRQMKRIDSIRKSPIFTHMDESLVGAVTVRAFGKQDSFIAKLDGLMEESQMAWYPIIMSQRWLAFLLEVLGAGVVFFATVFANMERGSLSGGLAGLSIASAMKSTWVMHLMIRGAVELETHIVSVERIAEYTQIDTEGPLEVDGRPPPPEWPEEGSIVFQDYQTRYRPGLGLVLKGITFSMKPKEKVGIVGRTGAGKSSLALSLFRIIEASGGAILIDGVNIAQIGLHSLRKRLTIIPQDPVLFSGTLRENIDPIGEYEDSEIWQALEQAHLKTYISTLQDGLDYECGEGGLTLSVGQRQLVCLARALLRKSKILVLDEATAAVDLETDSLIQATISALFSDSTVLTVAHRLNTIMAYDRVMVLDKGAIVEFGYPSQLLANHTSKFHKMAKSAGLV